MTVNSDSEKSVKEEVMRKSSLKRWLITVASLVVVLASNGVLANAGVEKLTKTPTIGPFRAVTIGTGVILS